MSIALKYLTINYFLITILFIMPGSESTINSDQFVYLTTGAKIRLFIQN